MRYYVKQTDTMYEFVDNKVITIEFYSLIKEYEDNQSNKYY
jgi:hypothetical protein